MGKDGRARRSRAQMIQETTEKLLAAARRSFAESGYHATSMDVLCAEVGLTRGALYHHFGGKEGLFEAVVRRIDAEILARIEMAYRAIEDPWEAFQAGCRTYIRAALEPDVSRILLQEAPAVMGERARQLDAEGSVGPIADTLNELMETDTIARTDAEALARMLNGAMLDAALWIASSEEPASTVERAESSLATLLAGLRILATKERNR